MRGIEARKDECRDARRFGVIDDLFRDLRHAARMLRRSPGFTAVAVLSLALGIGANTAVFSVIDGLMLKKLPVPHPHQLVYFREHFPAGRTNDELAYPRFERLRDGTRPFASFFTMNVFDRSNIELGGAGGGNDPGRARVAIVSGSPAGIAIGVPATVAATRLISSRRFRVSAADPPTIACAAAVMLAVATIAGHLPARRAARTDPMEALRCDAGRVGALWRLRERLKYAARS